MNKDLILQELRARLEEDMRRQRDANKRASAGATDSAGRAETKWDTCSLESSYLARGHAQQFEKLADDIRQLQLLAAEDFSNRPIATGALVEVAFGNDLALFYLLQCGGGINLTVEERELTIITPQTPIGVALSGKQKGDEFSFRAGSTGRIVSVE